MTAYEKHSYIMNVTKAYLDALPGDERWNPISSCEYSIPTDHVMVRDVGALPMEQAFYWLALGHEVWNHQGKSIGVRDLEQRFCPDPSVDPLWARMVLWKQHPAFEDYEPEDLFVLQPGLDPNLLDEAYRDRWRQEASYRAYYDAWRERINFRKSSTDCELHEQGSILNF
ncbi:hypothetical protein LTS18_007983, partial [Coniosporium uncinatum]